LYISRYFHTILQGALLTNAVAIILAHNHPSGNVKPSTEDINTTAKITKAAKLLDISVLDHIIYTRENCYSFADDGEI
jgi:DNA repair protein RadC